MTRGTSDSHRGMKLPHQLVAILPGHRDIGHEHVRAILDAGAMNPSSAEAATRTLAPADSNNRLQELARVVVVVHDDDARAR